MLEPNPVPGQRTGSQGLKISLIGMSNAGKTYWSQKLAAEAGFVRIPCDDLIEQRLGPYLQEQGYAGIEAVSEWMGQPYEARYPANSRRYLECENAVMQEVLRRLEREPGNVVVDTTGSVIYTERATIKKLGRLSRVVYIEMPQFLQDEMVRRFIQNPKPVIWGQVYTQRKNETGPEALVRCYPRLLEYRSQKYGKYADFTFDYFDIMNERFGVERLLKHVR